MKTNKYIIWLKRAKNNLYITRRLCILDDIFLEDLCHFCHQAVVRALIGFFIFFDKIPPKNFAIINLANYLSEYTAVTENIYTIGRFLSQYDSRIKYPSNKIVVKDDFERAYAAADECVTWVVSEIERISQKQLDLRK
jgi:HEPN domain-containing protein